MRTKVTTAVAVLALATTGAAVADSTPVGPLPTPVVTKVTTARGSLVAVSLPAQPARTGLVWRVARPLDTRVVKQVGEAAVGPAVVLVFRVVGRGRTSLHLALTRGRRVLEGRSRGPLRPPRDLTARGVGLM